MAGSLFGGIDAGATATKAAIIDEAGEVLGRAVERSGMDFEAAARAAFDGALKAAKLPRDAVTRTVSTGYGRRNVPFAAERKTELACHARGCRRYFPQALTVVDIGGQDNKIIHVDSDGGFESFQLNRKCAAGTGAFLEEIAGRLGVPLDELEALARQSSAEETLGSFCTVFTQTEILAKMRAGAKASDIVKGALRSVVKRIVEMDPLEGPVALTGGVVAHSPTIVEMFAERPGCTVLLPPDPQCAGALGAALFARGPRC
ncbi:MAG: ATPase [Elusimicrobia bacterium]|nr:ATPase [Elusimicrobiota bacterium]